MHHRHKLIAQLRQEQETRGGRGGACSDTKRHAGEDELEQPPGGGGGFIDKLDEVSPVRDIRNACQKRDVTYSSNHKQP